MVKKENFLFFRVFTITIIMLFVNLISFFYKSGIKGMSLTGFSIKTKVSEIYTTLSMPSKTFLFIQWGLLILVLIYSAMNDKKVSKRNKETIGLDLKKIRKDSNTDLDVLYNALQIKKQLSISAISQTFKIKEKLAMEWAKILESGNLAFIDYPRFSGPVLKIKETKMHELKKDGKKTDKKLHSKKELTKESKLKQKTKIKLDRKSKKEFKKFKKSFKKSEKTMKKQIRAERKQAKKQARRQAKKRARK